MRNLGSRQPGKSPGVKRQATAKRDQAAAYQRLFAGHGGAEDAELVLVDLAEFSGFYKTSPPGTTDGELRFREGARFVFAHIRSLLGLTEAELQALETAARIEALTIYE